MNVAGQPTLDQLRIFLAVVDEGSFNRAARAQGRAISAISYGMAQLEAQLGLTLFAREGSRRPVLTREGQALLADVRAVAADVDGLLARVRGLDAGLEAELSLTVDVMVPGDVLAAVLREFQRVYPTVPLRLHVEALGGVAAMLIDGRSSIGIAGPAIVDLPGLAREDLGSVELVPVAAPGHPLARSGVLPGESARHLQLVLTDRSPLSEGREFSVFSPNTWRLADLGAKHALLREGLGWGNMPRHAVAADIAAGALVVLDLPERPGIDYRLHALWRSDCPPGPAACWMREAFREGLAGARGDA